MDLLRIDRLTRVSKEFIFLKISEEKISITNNYKDGIYNKRLLETRLSDDFLRRVRECKRELTASLPVSLVELGTPY